MRVGVAGEVLLLLLLLMRHELRLAHLREITSSLERLCGARTRRIGADPVHHRHRDGATSSVWRVLLGCVVRVVALEPVGIGALVAPRLVLAAVDLLQALQLLPVLVALLAHVPHAEAMQNL